jgi:hypothetical protein
VDGGSGQPVVVPGLAPTVKTHLLRAFGKLGVSDRTAAVTTAIQRGDIPRPAGNCPCDHYSGWLLAP